MRDDEVLATAWPQAPGIRSETGEMAAGNAVVSTERRSSHVPDYIWGLDLIRLAAAVLVSLSHFIRFPIGVYGVEIFFVISGLVICQSADGKSAFDFLQGRVLRLYPAAWICTVINVAVLAAVHGMPDAIDASTSKSTIPAIVNSLTLLREPFVASAYWTLPVELVFYVLVVSLMALRLFARLPAVMLFLAVVSTTVNAVILAFPLVVHHDATSLQALTRAVPFLRQAVFFAIGVFLFVGLRRRRDARFRIALVLFVPAALLEFIFRALELPANHHQRVVMAIGGSLLWLTAAGAIVASLALNDGFAAPPRVKAWVRTAGLITYPYYLLHQVCGRAVMTVCAGASIGRGWSVPAAMLATALISYLVVRMPEIALRRAVRRLIETRVRPVLDRAALRQTLFRIATL